MGTLQPQDLLKKKKERFNALYSLLFVHKSKQTKPNQTQLTKKLPQAQFMSSQILPGCVLPRPVSLSCLPSRRSPVMVQDLTVLEQPWL